jgi:hypothetical protein
VSFERASRRALIVDPDAAFADDLAGRLHPYAEVATCTGFAKARIQLRGFEPQFLVTALALRESNGLHLVYLAGAVGLQTRSISTLTSSTSASRPKCRRLARFSSCNTVSAQPFHRTRQRSRCPTLTGASSRARTGATVPEGDAE